MKHRVRLWEWLIAASGAAFVAGVVGWLAYGTVARVDGPPELRVEITAIRASGSGFLVIVKASNGGGLTAAKTVIEGTLRRDGAAVETSTLEFDYVPPSSDRIGGLIFRNDPRAAELAVRAVSWIAP